MDESAVAAVLAFGGVVVLWLGFIILRRAVRLIAATDNPGMVVLIMLMLVVPGFGWFVLAVLLLVAGMGRKDDDQDERLG